ncbi:S8 family serine peptidase [Massilia sp. W12]|uniref:S8 family serine peptidase n=1 Tax=Massilia sp. W12 TaxID=3126507 RepID=UPI0030D1A3FA
MTKSNFKASAIACAVLAALTAAGNAAANENTRYVVHFKDGSHNEVRSAILAARANVKYQIHSMNAVSIEASKDGAKQLKGHKDVHMVEEDVKRYPFAGATPSTGAPYLSGQLVPYGIKQVQADVMPNGDANTANRKICIIDSGYDRAHEDLDNSANVTGEYDSGTGWWYTDENHHGTHVAGTIAALNNSGVGVVGVNPNKKLKLHIVKVFGKDGWAYSSSLSTAANKCKTAGANVISMSLGGPSYSASENTTFSNLAKAGILLIAAAGNDGADPDPAKATAVSYPAGYSSVISVGSIDENKQWSTFSQYNTKVELAGPGTNVLSTVPMGSGRESSASVAGVAYTVGGMTGSPAKAATAALFDMGIGDAVNAGAAGKICLIQRGTVDFATKVKNCESSGGVGAIVYNNAAGTFGGTLGTAVTNIPSVTATDVDGAAMKAQVGQSATVNVKATNYAYFDGTSMATPHVSAVAALVWSYFPTCTAAQMRITLQKSAQDLGAAGRDVKFGFGLVQAKAAYDRIKSLGCGK